MAVETHSRGIPHLFCPHLSNPQWACKPKFIDQTHSGKLLFTCPIIKSQCLVLRTLLLKQKYNDHYHVRKQILSEEFFGKIMKKKNTQTKVQKCQWQKFHLLFSASFLVSFWPPAHLPQPWKLSSAFRLQLSLLMPLLTMLHPYWLLLLISVECMGRNEIRFFGFITLMALCDPSVNKLSFFLLNNNNSL